ncbi:MAG: hypothetical protein CMJ49_00765 [Planctomycetaceae bacterium]|nr:hypothetical protein [Planctomycetaceae bacterium]
MPPLRGSIVGFDITPDIHPQFGAWGTTPNVTEIAMPLLARCLALQQDHRTLLWFASDLCGNPPAETQKFRAEVADALDLTPEQIVWSTSQTHSSATLPGSDAAGGSSVTRRGNFDPPYVEQQYKSFINHYINAGRAALDSLQPIQIQTGIGYCDTMSYNTRFPMPTGGTKFSRHHEEGLQSGKFFDPTISLVRFDDAQGKPLGALFNFCCHPATMINDKYISPDWVGTARQHIEATINHAPTMFVQGMCGDVNCYHIFGTPDQAGQSGDKLAAAAAQAMANLAPVRATPFDFRWQPVEIDSRPMFTRAEIDHALQQRLNFIERLDHTDPTATWCDGINFPEQITPELRKLAVQPQIDYLKDVDDILTHNKPYPKTITVIMGALRLGDLAALFSQGENFTLTGRHIRDRSPFPHTLICGDTNGLVGYIGDDPDIDRAGYETTSFWMMRYGGELRLAPAKGAVNRIKANAQDLLTQLRQLDES